MNKIFKVGLIGCGHISETYFRAEKYFNNIKIIKFDISQHEKIEEFINDATEDVPEFTIEIV